MQTHKKLSADFNLDVSCINECSGEMWDPYSPVYKTLTEIKTAELAISETKSSIDFASELNASFVTVAVTIHKQIDEQNVQECTQTAVWALRKMCDYAKTKGIRRVAEKAGKLGV